MGARVGVVTGGSRGMGLACAARLGSLVDVVFVTDRDGAGAEVAAAALGASSPARFVPRTVDVCDPAALAALADAVRDTGTLRAVAHAAGISPTMAAAPDILRVDLVGTARAVAALRPLVGPGTAMVCFASMAAQLGAAAGDPALDRLVDDPLAPDLLDRLRETAGAAMDDPANAYTWAKRGVQRLVRREAVVWGPLGGRINSLSPGIIDTPMGRQEFAAQPAMATLVEMTPLRREGTADELAAAAAFLLSDDASFVTGTDLLVDGGVVAAVGAAFAR
jgi:NAD(P)-dependent dehydrogenase (short-subunit alcohol dehydrogenase family)